MLGPARCQRLEVVVDLAQLGRELLQLSADLGGLGPQFLFLLSQVFHVAAPHQEVVCVAFCITASDTRV